MRFAQSSHLLMYMSLGTLTSTIRTFWPILVELIDLVNFAIIFVILLTMVNFPTRILDYDSTALPFWIYFFLVTLFLLIMLFQFPLTFLQNQTRMLIFIVQLMTILGRIMMVVVIICEIRNGRISLNLVLLRLLLNFVCR